jgi:Beta-L-arabinofuranosidase, GH127 middle domain
VQLDRANKAPSVENEGTMFSYSPFEVYRCCQHNVSHGWPYYAEELWLATSNRGLCASLYAASEVTAKVSDGQMVTISEETNYPFSEIITFKISVANPVKLLLHLRIPAWCQHPIARIDGTSFIPDAKSASYTVIDRTWHDGETLTLKLPMQFNVRRWEKNQNAASVYYGPLAFSLKIGERWTRYGKVEAWPESEVFPTTPWNYGLELETPPDRSFEIVRKSGRVATNPFTPETAPIVLRVKARRISQWQQDKLGVVGKLQPSPVKTDAALETVSLIPMGAARLRITTFPVIGHDADAREWAMP